MTITNEQFRDALRHFAAGVTIVTARDGESVHGMTVSAFTSVSAEPPLVAVVVDRRHTLTELLAAERASFAVSILGGEQAALSDRFAFVKDEDRFAEGRWAIAATGAPVLEDALAWLDCRLAASYPAGSHVIYVGEVVASWATPEGGEPLVYWDRAYRKLVR
jgi:flavin reductase (DIM6/NTAB) family NADH-FMN oxidoreductase RutF